MIYELNLLQCRLAIQHKLAWCFTVVTFTGNFTIINYLKHLFLHYFCKKKRKKQNITALLTNICQALVFASKLTQTIDQLSK